MTEHSILLADWEVQAVRNCRKTRISRLVKPQPEPDEFASPIPCERYHPALLRRNGEEYPGPKVFGFCSECAGWECPFGGPGDLLWVRECWGLRLAKDWPGLGKFGDWLTGQACLLHADHVPMQVVYRADRNPKGARWRSSATMPRWASRRTLRVTDVQGERVQEISEANARAEGVTEEPDFWNPETTNITFTYRGGVRHLWDSTHAKPRPVRIDGKIAHYESYPWEDIQETREHRGLPWYIFGNPWIWAGRFEVVK